MREQARRNYLSKDQGRKRSPSLEAREKTVSICGAWKGLFVRVKGGRRLREQKGSKRHNKKDEAFQSCGARTQDGECNE